MFRLRSEYRGASSLEHVAEARKYGAWHEQPPPRESGQVVTRQTKSQPGCMGVWDTRARPPKWPHLCGQAAHRRQGSASSPMRERSCAAQHARVGRAPGHAAKLLARKVLARDGPDTPSMNHGRRFFAFEDRCISPLTSSNAGVRRPSIRVDHTTMHPGRRRSNMRR